MGRLHVNFQHGAGSDGEVRPRFDIISRRDHRLRRNALNRQVDLTDAIGLPAQRPAGHRPGATVPERHVAMVRPGFERFASVITGRSCLPLRHRSAADERGELRPGPPVVQPGISVVIQQEPAVKMISLH